MNYKISSAYPEENPNKNKLKLNIHRELLNEHTLDPKSLVFSNYLDVSEAHYI